MRLALASSSMLDLMLTTGPQWWLSLDLWVVEDDDAMHSFVWLLLRLRERGVSIPHAVSVRLETQGIRSRRFGKLLSSAFPGLQTLAVRSRDAVECGVVLDRGMTALRTLAISTDSCVTFSSLLRDLPLVEIDISYWSRTKNEDSASDLALARHLPTSVTALRLEAASYSSDGEMSPLLPPCVGDRLISLTLADVWVRPGVVAAAVRGMPHLSIFRFDNRCWCDNINVSDVVDALPTSVGVLELGLGPDTTSSGEAMVLASSEFLQDSLCARPFKDLFSLTLNGIFDVPTRLPPTLRQLKMRNIQEPVAAYQVTRLVASLPALKHLLICGCAVEDSAAVSAAVSAQAPKLVFCMIV